MVHDFKEFYNTEINNILAGLPAVLFGKDQNIYFLIQNLSCEMESFLHGKSCSSDINLFSEADEKKLISDLKENGLRYRHCKQLLEFNYQKVNIIYLQIFNPETGVKISLIPWFFLPDRPYPAFVYVYANWHYSITGNASLSQSAGATGKLFGIPQFNKSTLSRSNRTMEQLFNQIGLSNPLPCEESENPTAHEEDIGHVLGLLKTCPDMNSLIDACSTAALPLPDAVNRKEKGLLHAFSNIPPKYSEVIKKEPQAKRKNKDRRKRPARERKQGTSTGNLKFIAPHQIKQIQTAFIQCCKTAVLGMASAHHRFLL